MHSYLSQSEKTKNENSLHCWQWHRCNFPHPRGSQGKYEAQGHGQVNISMWSSRCSSACSSHCDHFYRTTSSTCCNSSSMSPAAKASWRRWGNSAQLHGQPLHSPCCELHKKKKKDIKKMLQPPWNHRKLLASSPLNIHFLTVLAALGHILVFSFQIHLPEVWKCSGDGAFLLWTMMLVIYKSSTFFFRQQISITLI